MHLSLFDYTVFTVFIISLSVFFQKSTPFYLKTFSLYYLAALINGMIMEWLSDHGKYNVWLGNLWGIFEFCFYFYLLHEIIISARIKRVILFVMLIFFIFASVNIFFIQKKVGFNPVNFTIGSLITVTFCITYFIELFQKAENHYLSRLPSFWIGSALLFTTVLSFPMLALESFMEQQTKLIASHLIFDHIEDINNIILILTSVLFSIGFLCRIRISKSTL
jgi:hypothetical protein